LRQGSSFYTPTLQKQTLIKNQLRRKIMPNQTIKGRSAKISRGKTLLQRPVLNKGMVFNDAEREALGLH
jgi:hypothetical protein